MKNLRGKKALVTGAAWGIGREIALGLARQGVELFLVDIDAEQMVKVVEEITRLGVPVVGHECDVADMGQVDRAVAAALAHWGRVDILVNNAGIMYFGDTHEMKPEFSERIMAVNLIAPLRFITGLLPTMRNQAESHILNVASIVGWVPKRRVAVYQTTKFGLVGLSLSLRAEYIPYNIGVTALCPGLVRTNIFDAAEKAGMMQKKPKIKAWYFTSAELVAKHAIAGIRRNRALVVVPFLAKVFWLMQRFSPRILDWQTHYTHRRRRREHVRKFAEASRQG